MTDKKQNNNTKSKFVYDENKKGYVFNDGVINGTGDLIENFNVYYSWVCEKADNDEDDYKAWKETLGFLSVEKYRAYIEKDNVRIRLLEVGLLLYINKAISSSNMRIRVLGFRQAIQWGYPSVILNERKKFNDTKRYLRFLLNIAKRYYVTSAIKRVNLESYTMMGNFEQFFMGIVTLSFNKKNELITLGRETIDQSKPLFFSDSDVDWSWLTEDLFKCEEENEFRGLLLVLHLSLKDYLRYRVEKSCRGTLEYWDWLIKEMESSDKEWIPGIVKKEKELYKQMRNDYKLLF